MGGVIDIKIRLKARDSGLCVCSKFIIYLCKTQRTPSLICEFILLFDKRANLPDNRAESGNNCGVQKTYLALNSFAVPNSFFRFSS